MPDLFPSSILIVRLSAIGDVVHTLPGLRALRRRFPDARIGWLAEELSAPVLVGHPHLDKLYVIPKKRWRGSPWRTLLNGESRDFFRNLRADKWEVAIDFQGLTKSGLAAWRSGAKKRIGFAGEDARELNRLFTNTRILPPPDARHVIERNLSLLQALDIKTEKHDVAWDFPDFSREEKELEPFLIGENGGLDLRNGFLALNVGAGWETKRWPSTYFARLLITLAQRRQDVGQPPFPAVLIWGPGEEHTCQEIIGTCGNSLPVRLAPPTNLRQLAALLGKATVLVGGDTGPVHLGAALGVPVVGIYGGSDPVRNGPWGNQNIVIQARGPECIPCWRTNCKYTQYLACMKSIQPETVADAVEKLWLEN
ncbi:glycosyltransferase family 9 protein [bacterium]|nr:glycosyltransferase family 9 protein [bacterium]